MTKIVNASRIMESNTISTILEHPDTAVAFIRQHPSLLFTYAKRRNIFDVERKHLAIHLSSLKADYDRFIQEHPGIDEVGLMSHLERIAESSCFLADMFYYLVRMTKPQVVVETGVYLGVSSAYILQAMKDNGFGDLYSIDVDYKPRGVRVGEYVPDNLKKNWHLILQDSKIALPELLGRLGLVDIFMHDSLHTYEHMLHEFEIGWPSVRKGGYLLSDDVDENNAFDEFSAKYPDSEKHILNVKNKQFGITRK